ncbi:LAMP1 [Branchiostoma lanceolatum]|uniref:LAMP1 protein n=1 Tax=Branchiostoma lanceolatum TaxID=7740 RepID=A0A8K0EEK8_BRALA|nr:LAMP1 [Branchiostoma lanceolatum]
MVTRLTTVYTLTETLFPWSKHPNTTHTVSSPENILLAHLGQSYRCNSSTPVKFGSTVNATFFGLKVQPFEVQNNTFGGEEVCSDDLPHTTPEPTTHPHTTPHPNITTPMPTTTPPPPHEGTWYVKGKDGKPCLLADAAIQLKIPYNTTGNKTRTAFIDVPRAATAGGSCGANNSSLSLHFNPGNVTLQLGFRKEGKMKTDFVLWSAVVTYKEDPVIFKNTSSPGRRVKLENKSLKKFETKLGMAYKCDSKVALSVNRSVEMEFVNTTIQPFGVEGGKFGNESVCPEDKGHTTPLPHTNHTTPLPHTNHTTPLPHTNHTTAPPHTNHTTPVPHTTPHHTTPHHTTPHHTTPPHTTDQPLVPFEPKQGNYTVKGKDNKPCILANMAIQFHIKYNKTNNKQAVARFNADVTGAIASGDCGQDKSTLTLSFFKNNFNLTFEFAKAKMGAKGGESFRAETIELSYEELEVLRFFPYAKDPGQVRQASNKSAHAFETEANHSYKCMAVYNLTLTKGVEILVSKVHLQPFGVHDGEFSAAHECSLDPKPPSSPDHSAAIAAGIVVPLVVIIAAAAGFFLYRRRKMSGNGNYESLKVNL